MMRNEILRAFIIAAVIPAIIVATFGGALASSPAKQDQKSGEIMLTDAEIENVVRRSYQYVAMYNVNNKFAIKQGGWNTVDADTKLKDHTMREIARPNNDTLYISALIDLRKDAGDPGNAGLRFRLRLADGHRLRSLRECADGDPSRRLSEAREDAVLYRTHRRI